jgi:hypothetical protein
VVGKFTGAVGILTVLSGTGGQNTGPAEGGSGGAGGLLEKVTLTISGVANESTTTTILSGGGGDSANLTGGNSGEIKGIKITDKRIATEIVVRTGNGGDGANTGGAAANLGGVSVVAPNGLLRLVGGDGGDSNRAAGVGGAGGNIGTSKATVNLFRTIGGDGGGGTNGTGGAGGAVSGLTVKAKSSAQQIRAGAGGDGTVAGGAGGGVTGVKVSGDIGDFFRPFGIQPFNDSELEMGGLFAGKGGSGAAEGVAGSIANVTAKRIAAIIAVNDGTDADNLNASNAVTAISGIKTKVIGADIDGDGVFDFTDVGAAGFNLGGGDTAIDGLVIVKASGVPAGGLKPEPLLIITV